MALVPILEACIPQGCTSLRPTDITGVYQPVNNPTGWEDASTEFGVDITSATIEVFDAAGTSVLTADVTSQIPDTVTGNIQFNDIPWTDYADGWYEIVYTVVGANGIYTYRLVTVFLCSARCCLDKMWAKIAEIGCGNCNCNLKKELDAAFLAEGLYNATLSAAGCISPLTVDKLTKKISKLCSAKDCDCGCN